MKSIAYTSAWIPKEWILAHGFKPVLVKPKGKHSLSDSGEIEGCCEFARLALDHLLHTKHHAVIFATTCDQMRRSTEIFSNGSSTPLFLFNIPATCATSSFKFFKDELIRLSAFLVRIGGRKPDRKSLGKILSEKAANAKDLKTISSHGKKHLPVAVIGPHSSSIHDDILSMIQKAGCKIVSNGLEEGPRTLMPEFKATKRCDPFTEMALTYHENIKDLFRRPNTEFYIWLRRELKDSGAKGLIILRFTWCDIWHAESVRMRNWLDIPVLSLEISDVSSKAQIRNKIEAFTESL